MSNGASRGVSSEAIDVLADLLQEAGLRVRISEELPALPIGRDAQYSIALLFLAMRILGKRVDYEAEWLVANYHVCGFCHFACRRPRIVEEYSQWSRHRYRKHEQGLLSWPALPRGFLADQVFGATCVLLSTMGQARVERKNLLVSAKKDSMFAVWTSAVDSLALFTEERNALESLASSGLSQAKLGVA